MSEKQKAALDALASLPQDKRDQALTGMEFLSIGYQMGLAVSEAKEADQEEADPQK